MVRYLLLAVLVAIPFSACAATPPSTVLISGSFLAQAREHPTPALMEAVRTEANHAMSMGPFSVMEKKEIPPSGDKHDYMSLAPYWWPNPNTPNGLPYVRRDGQTNPEVNSIPDHANLFHLEDAVHALALGYYFTGDERYATRAVLLLRTWFLNSATRMNPNLNYAQAIPGITQGRGIGLIGMRGITGLLDSVALLSGAASFTPADRAGLHVWFAQYLNWLQTSPNGRAEAAAKNNHGSWYDQQLVAIAIYLGRDTLARNVLDVAKTKRIAFQIKADGREPLELARTKSFSYSVFNLSALMHLAMEGQHAGVDLWGYRAPDGGSIRAALNFLLPYALGKPWPYQSLNGVEAGAMVQPLLWASIAYHDAGYLTDAEKIDQRRERAGTLLLQLDAEHLFTSPK